MSIHVEIVTVANIHGVTEAATVGATMSASAQVAYDTHTGVVLDEYMGTYSTVQADDISLLTGTMAEAHAAALKIVQAKLTTSYTLSGTALPASGLHIWVPREGWVEIEEGAGLSYAFQLQINSSMGAVDVKSVLDLNGTLVSVDVLVVVQTP